MSTPSPHRLLLPVPLVALFMPLAWLLPGAGPRKQDPRPPAPSQDAGDFLPEPNLLEVRLGPGDHGSLNVDWWPNGAEVRRSSEWLAQGYEGVRFVGEGAGKTHLRCTSWDGNTVAVRRSNLTVELRGLSLHSGYQKGIHFGEQNEARQLSRRFRLRLVDVEAVVDPPFDYFAREGQFRLVDGGKGYRVGDRLSPVGGEAERPAVFVVARVSEEPDPGQRTIRSLSVLDRGLYSTGPTFDGAGVPTTTTGAGEGCVLSLGARPKWLVFGYQADVLMTDVALDATEAVEHAVYLHGFARRGAWLERVEFRGSGAEGFKVRSDASETAWAGPNQWVVLRDCRFRECHQRHTWRGGAFVVLQGTGAHAWLERCLFVGGAELPPITAAQRSRAVFVSSEANSYDQASGAVGTGTGNGHVTLQRCVCVGGPGAPWWSPMVRCGRNGGTQLAARSFTVRDCGFWGERMSLQASELAPGTLQVTGCNTPTLRAWAAGRGLPSLPEVAVLTSARPVPLSEGFSR